MGEVTKKQVLEVCINDLLIHTWDLARAIGADESLPEEAVQACYASLQKAPPEMLRGSGNLADPISVPRDADLQARLLAFTGRRP